MKHFYYICICIIAVALSSCHNGRIYFPKDIQPADIQLVRFDSALLSLGTDSASIRAGIAKLKADYPVFMPVFAEEIIGIPMEETDYLAEALPAFLEDTVYGFKATNQKVQETFQDVRDLQQALNQAFGRLHYLYPEFTLPRVYFFVSGFNGSLIFVDEDIAIGADMYLGSDYPYYNRVVHEYQKLTMRKECIPADVVSAYLFMNLPFTSDKSRLLENMIYRGKVMYLLMQLLPEEKAWETFGYTKEKWDWAVRNESAIWRLMMDKQDLYKTETLVMTSYLNDGPFTSEISQDCPARIGTWIGLRIVEQYMNNNQDITLQELMKEGDAQRILQLSNYRP